MHVTSSTSTLPMMRFRWPRLALAVVMSLGLLAPLTVRAQEEDEATVDDERAGPAPIISTRTGEVPTFGGRRPGPFNLEPAPVIQRAGIAPISIQIEQAAVDAEVERLQVVEGRMQNPTGPWIVAWYENLAGLGEGGNVVMAGHIDYWNVGPAVFFSIDQLSEGDEVTVTGEDGEQYTYAVDWVREYNAADAPLDEIVGGTGTDTLTLITCGGTFDYATGEYLQRTVVRASFVAPDA